MYVTKLHPFIQLAKKVRPSYFWFAFPIQLIIYHLRSNLLLLLMWLVTALLINGDIAAKFGVRYLFLNPEYLGATSFWSFFFLGLAFGCFYLTWNLTSYLLCAHNFPFLATLSQPFTKFCLNNFLIPLAFFVFYVVSIILFQGRFMQAGLGNVAQYCTGIITGFLAMILLYLLYFHHTNHDISYYEKRQPSLVSLLPHITPGYRTLNWDHAKADHVRWRVDLYLNESFLPRRVRSVAHYNSETLKKIFRQNHLNALVIQLATMMVLTALGWLIDYPAFQIPAGASIFFLFSIIIAVIGALSYWFHLWRMTVILLLLCLINYLTGFDAIHPKNRAYGLDYQHQLATYNYPSLQKNCTPDQVKKDKKLTIKILNRWKQKILATEPNKKPKMVFICVSGGGLRSATWAIKVVQQIDRITKGKFFEHTVLITGASGGMLGMAYFRELALQKKQGKKIALHDPRHIDIISKDILNGVAFTLVANDVLWPWSNIRINQQRFPRDRGYMFEKKLNENTEMVMDKPLKNYQLAEQKSLVPMMYLSPSIVNDVRRLIISPQPVSFMMASPGSIGRTDELEIDAVDFGRFFKHQRADSLRFLTALRMNATFPFILPSVNLPSNPRIEVMDAGFLDNFGLSSTTRFIQVFSDWILAHTSGVMIVQITSSDKFEPIPASDQKGVIGTMLNPFSIVGQILNRQKFEQDNSLAALYQLFGKERLQMASFTYHPGRGNRMLASISLHLTAKEKEAVTMAIDDPDNQVSLKKIIDIFEPLK